MLFELFSEKELRWLPSIGIGFYQFPQIVYNGNYSAEEKVDLVNSYTKLDVLDIGIDNANFVQSRENTYGYDITNSSPEWLIQRRLYRHPFKGANSVTFWNTLQKIQDPRLHLSGAREYVFITCPIYRDVEHVINSEQFSRHEDFWYFTFNGLLTFMDAFGFEVIESKISHDIGVFVFKKY